jgi:response regulator NasT
VVAVEAPLRLDAIAVLKETGADVVIMAPSLAGGRERTLMPHITAALDCPAVLFTRDTERAMVRQAKRAGVMGFMLKPLRAAELAPTLELAQARFRELRRLQQARTERPLVDRAKSKLMSDARLSEDEAFRWLRRRAMDSRRRLGDVAREVLGDDAALEPAGASTR